jgi:DtxR family Mn-dependent transcriptional regulator
MAVSAGRVPRSESVEDYLVTVYRLESEGERPVAARIAERLRISAPSVSEMIKRLVDEGLLARRADRSLELTQEGSRLAAEMIRRHRLAERLLTDLLGMPPGVSHEEAHRLEHALSTEVTERLAEVLGHPSHCPHGHPIPQRGADGPPPPEREGTVSLLDVGPGDRAAVAILHEEDRQLLDYLWALGLAPGTEVEVVAVAPFDGPLELRIGVAGASVHMGRTAAAAVRVRPVGVAVG